MGIEKDVSIKVNVIGHTETVAPSALLAARISAVRRKQVAVAAGTGAGMAVGAFVILLGAAMLLDWWLDFPVWVRGIILVCLIAFTGVIAWRYVLMPIRRQPDDDAVALRIEKARPQFRSRLISSVQFARPGVIPPGAATSLARMTIAETEALAAPMNFADVISTKELSKVLIDRKSTRLNSS